MKLDAGLCSVYMQPDLNGLMEAPSRERQDYRCKIMGT